MAALRGIRRRGKRAIVAGGTGFYIRALTGGVALAPQYDERLRGRLAREALAHPAGVSSRLARSGAIRFAPRALATRTIRTAYLRALEIALAAPAATLRDRPPQTLRSEGIPYLLVFLDVPCELVGARIASSHGAHDRERLGRGSGASRDRCRCRGCGRLSASMCISARLEHEGRAARVARTSDAAICAPPTSLVSQRAVRHCGSNRSGRESR